MELYQKAIIKDRVPVDLLDLVMFYVNSLFAVGAGIYVLYENNFTRHDLNTAHPSGMLNIIGLALFAFGLFALALTRKHFRFTFIQCQKPLKEKEVITNNVADAFKLMLNKKDTQYFQFRDDFSWSKWPYTITIIYNDNGFYINSLNTRWKPIDRGGGMTITRLLIDKIEELQQ